MCIRVPGKGIQAMRSKALFLRFLVAMTGIGAGTATLAASDEGFDCIVTPSRTIEVGSAVAGVLENVLVDRSDKVAVGEVVASLDSRVERANLEIARFRANNDTEVKLREAAMEIDQRTQRRLSSLAAQKVASKQDRDRALRDARLSKWRARQAKDDQRLSELELLRAEANLQQRVIRSPIDGVIVERMRNPGEYIDDQPVVRVVQLDPLHVEAILPMNLFGRIEAGMTASVLPEFNGNPYQAKVAVIDPMGDASSGTFGVRLIMDNPEGAIPAGLKCRVQFDGAELESDGLLIEGYLPDSLSGDRLSVR